MNQAAMSRFDLDPVVFSSAVASNTRLAYEKGWVRFTAYCAGEHIDDPFEASPDAVARFLVHCATRPRSTNGVPLSMGTVVLYNSAITKRYTDAGKTSPTHHPLVRATLKGLARIKGTVPRQVKALREEHIRAMIARCPDSVIGFRDGALLALGFAAALRRSELCGLSVDDVTVLPRTRDHPRRMLLTIRRSKTDQAGNGQTIPIPEGRLIRPIHRVQTWLSASGITHGPLFRAMKRGGSVREGPLHPSDVPRLVKHYAALIGLDPKEVSGHSLRAGFATSAAAHRARIDKIMAITRHTNPTTVMKYIRDAEAFTDHAGAGFL